MDVVDPLLFVQIDQSDCVIFQKTRCVCLGTFGGCNWIGQIGCISFDEWNDRQMFPIYENGRAAIQRIHFDERIPNIVIEALLWKQNNSNE